VVKCKREYITDKMGLTCREFLERGWGGMITVSDVIQVVIAVILLITLVVHITDRRR